MSDTNKRTVNTDYPDIGYEWVFFIGASVILAGLGLRDPWPADEPRFVQVVREMAQSGDWWFPHRGGELYADKPPVFFWILGVFYQLTGSLKLAFLLPSAACALLTMHATYDLAKRLWNERVGVMAAIVLLCTLQFVLQSKTAQIDMMVTCWITLACYGLLRHMLLGPAWGWYLFGAAMMGLGIITKGVGFLPILLLLPFALYSLRKPVGLRVAWEPELLWVIPVMLAVVALWLVPTVLMVSQSADPDLVAYRDNILFHQTADRYAHASGHIRPAWYFVVEVIPFLWLPITLMLPGLLKPWWRALKENDGRIVLPLLWVLLVIAFFSASSGKRGVYVLPALPMLALAVAPYLDSIRRTLWFRLLVGLVLLLVGVAFAALGIAGLADMPEAVALGEKYRLRPWWFTLAMAVAILWPLWLCWKRKPLLAWAAMATGFWLLYSTWGYSLLNPIRTPINVMSAAGKLMAPGDELALIDFREQFLLHAETPVVHFGYHSSDTQQQAVAWQWMQEGEGRHVLIPDDATFTCFDKDKARALGVAHGRNWLVLGKDALVDQCQLNSEGARSYRFVPESAFR